MRIVNLVGKKVGRLTVVEQVAPLREKPQEKYWRCICDCGNEKTLPTGYLNKTDPRKCIRSCGCLSRDALIAVNKKREPKLEGHNVGLLTVLSRVAEVKDGHHHWVCKCECGNTTTVSSQVLMRKKRIRGPLSCGCTYVSDAMRYKRTYRTWASMISRTRPTAVTADMYHDRGITVCERWLDFKNFYADMGPSPAGYQLFRQDLNQGFHPDNCRWMDRCGGRTLWRNRKILEHNGISKTVSQWSLDTGIAPHVINKRLSRGWTVGRALGMEGK